MNPERKWLRKRARLLSVLRAFFDARGFLEVETPLLVPCPGLDVHLDAVETNAEGSARYLITSPEYQMKRLLAEGYDRIYQLAKCFRRGEKGSRHNPEFTMLEWYRAHAGMEDVLSDTEQLVAEMTQGAIQLGSRTLTVRPPFPRISVAEAFRRWGGVDEAQMLAWAANDEDAFFRTLVDRVEPALASMDEPVFLTDYPTEQASLARRNPHDRRYAERFELYVAGVELCNGFGELVDPKEQRERFEADQRTRASRGLPVYPLDERFLEALEKGIPPSGGNALGVDRLVALVCGVDSIEPVIAFTVDEL